MKNLFLTSSNSNVMHDVIAHIPSFTRGMKLAFIPTAAEVEEGDKSWLHADRQALIDVGFDVFDFTFKNSSIDEVKKALDPVDIIMVAGGNTYYLLQEMQRSGAIPYLRERVAAGMVYIGSSAGSIVAGPDVKLTWGLDDPSKSPELENEKALHLTDVVVFPHWASPYFQAEYRSTMISAYTKGEKIVLLTDDQYLWVKDDWYQIMSIPVSTQ